MKNCIFCRIIAGEIPGLKVYEDELVLAFMDIAPINAFPGLKISIYGFIILLKTFFFKLRILYKFS